MGMHLAVLCRSFFIVVNCGHCGHETDPNFYTKGVGDTVRYCDKACMIFGERKRLEKVINKLEELGYEE